MTPDVIPERTRDDSRDMTPPQQQPSSEDRLAALDGADEVATEIHRIYGSDLRRTGVVHVMAVWQRDDGPLVTLRTGGDGPRTAHDALALGLARARADAIVTTGEILRREAELRHDLPGPGNLPSALRSWRAEVLGKTVPPLLWVMTRSGEVDLDHPAFSRPARSVIYTRRAGAWALESRAADAGVELVAVPEPSARDAVDRLRREFGAATIVVEAGPSVARQLYETADARAVPARIDELLLTVLHAADLPTRFRGPRFLPRGDVEQLLGRPRSTVRVSGGDGRRWELARYVRS